MLISIIVLRLAVLIAIYLFMLRGISLLTRNWKNSQDVTIYGAKLLMLTIILDDLFLIVLYCYNDILDFGLATNFLQFFKYFIFIYFNTSLISHTGAILSQKNQSHIDPEVVEEILKEIGYHQGVVKVESWRMWNVAGGVDSENIMLQINLLCDDETECMMVEREVRSKLRSKFYNNVAIKIQVASI